MSRSAENQNWAILAQHKYAQETLQVMNSIMLLTALCSPASMGHLLEQAEEEHL